MSGKLLACTCDMVQLMDRIPVSDFIATAKILNISPDKEDSNVHDIQIEIMNLYKGQPTSQLKLNSSLKTSCAFYTPVNSEWLIFASKNKNGELSFGYCSGAIQLDVQFDSEKYPYAEKNHKNSTGLKLQVLEYVKNAEIQVSNEFGLRTSFASECLEDFKGYEVKMERFALYELTVEKDLSISEVKPLKEFDNENLKADLLNCVKSIKVFTRKKEPEIPNKTKMIVPLYYYAAERGHESFIGRYDL